LRQAGNADGKKWKGSQIAKRIVPGEDSRQAILHGINMLANAVKNTLG
jgi:hypothetical protein